MTDQTHKHNPGRSGREHGRRGGLAAALGAVDLGDLLARVLEQRGLSFSHAWYSKLGSVDDAAGLDDFGTKDLERVREGPVRHRLVLGS